MNFFVPPAAPALSPAIATAGAIEQMRARDAGA